MSRSQRIARDAVTSLLAHRQRALLMRLGVVVGVAVLSAVIVIGAGTRARIMDLVGKHGLDMLMVRAGGEVQVFAPRADRGLSVLFPEDARAIEAEVPNIRMVSTVANQRGIEAVYLDRAVTTRAFAVEPDWLHIRRWRIAAGEFVDEQDLAGLARVVILGDHVARSLFPDGGAVGETVRINGDPYVVKGVFEPMGSSAGGDNWDDRIVVPATTAARRLFGRPHIEQIVIQVVDARRATETAERVRDVLRERHRIGAGEPDDFFVREPEHVEDTALETSSTLTGLLIGVSLVALLAGGLVIMNVMLLGVSQRAHEIGVRRAVGARPADIARQFLVEALAVSLAGGVVGVVLGVAAAGALALAGVTAGRVTWVPFALALVACTALGLAFGLHPAKRAAALDPATALRERGA